MTTTRHTPGPWEMCPGNGCWRIVAPALTPPPSPAYPFQIPEPPEVARTTWGEHGKGVEANAALIAAAPDLLAAVEEWFAACEWMSTALAERAANPHVHSPSTERVMRAEFALRHAVKKARGGA